MRYLLRTNTSYKHLAKKFKRAVLTRVGLNLNFESAYELLINLNLNSTFAKSMNLNLVLSKSMNLNLKI